MSGRGKAGTVAAVGSATLRSRLAGARGLLRVAGDRLPPDLRADLAVVVERSAGRLAVAGDHTVVALAGPTGVGKSSVFNAVLGADIATTGVRRPTTARPTAAVVSTEPVAELMAHVGITNWHNVAVSAHPALESLVLVDLPDHDSVEVGHRRRASEIVAVADRLVWVVDPDKYADSSVHDDLLAPLQEHAGILTVVLNRSDRLDEAGQAEVAADLRRLLAADGLGDAGVLVTSARTGAGIDRLVDLLARTIRDHDAATERIAADLCHLAVLLDPHVPPAGDGPAVSRELVPAAMAAAGVPTVLEAVANSHRHRARRATGWPPLRRFQARGRDPLRRLGLGRMARDRNASGPAEVGSRSSRPLPHGVATATLATAVRDVVDRSTAQWPDAWIAPVESRLDDVVEDLPVRLDRAIVATDLDDDTTPAWWIGVGILQWVATIAAVAGALWLAAAFVVAWLQLPDLPSVSWLGIPVPTWLLVGGVGGGLLLGALSNQAAKVGAGRAARRVRRRLQERVDEVVDDTVARALATELDRAAGARAHLDDLAG